MIIGIVIIIFYSFFYYCKNKASSHSRNNTCTHNEILSPINIVFAGVLFSSSGLLKDMSSINVSTVDPSNWINFVLCIYPLSRCISLLSTFLKLELNNHLCNYLLDAHFCHLNLSWRARVSDLTSLMLSTV